MGIIVVGGIAYEIGSWAWLTVGVFLWAALQSGDGAGCAGGGTTSQCE